MTRSPSKRRSSETESLVDPTIGELTLRTHPSGTGSSPFVFARPQSGELEWERLATEIQASLASDLVALGLALRKLSMTRPNRALVALRPADPLAPSVRVEGGPEDPRSMAERAASVDLRLAQVRRTLELMGVVVPPSPTHASPLEPSSKTSIYGFLQPSEGREAPLAPTFPLEPLPYVTPPSPARRSKSARRRRSRASARSAPAKSGSGSRSPKSNLPRAIGGPVRPSMSAFLLTNRTEQFDIQMLNALPLPTLLEEAHGDRSLLAAAAQQAEELMARVKHEVDDPASAGAFLREQVRYWHDESGKDPTWAARMPERWAGLFSDSRVHGGRLRPWLNHRLWTLHERAFEGGPLRKRWARRLRGDGTEAQSVDRSPSEVIRAEVAQAILDDLATHPRDPEVPLPLISLSELAVRRQVVTVNEVLGQLFSVPDAGPFVLLHPNRYPGCEETVIRPPVPRARGAALAYTLGPARPATRPAAPPRPVAREPVTEQPRERAVVAASPATTPRSDEPVEAEPPSGLDADSIWEADSVSASAWREVVEMTRESRGRLSAPPGEFRSRRAYPVLIDRLLEDADFRRAFLAVRWRTRPAGPCLLATLLAEGSLVSEVSTDHEYLEAELDELVKAGRATKPGEGRWTARGYAIAREGSHQEGFRFRAQPMS